jgi:hypothetical protein
MKKLLLGLEFQMGFGHIREKLRKRKEINEKRKSVVIFGYRAKDFRRNGDTPT